MSVVRFFAPENRLGKAVAEPGGKKIEDAIADADMQLVMAAAESALKIDEILNGIYKVAGSSVQPSLKELYPLAREVAGLAGIAGLPDLGAGAHTFCCLIEVAEPKGALNNEQMQVSIGVLQLLRHPERFSEEERAALLENLNAVLEKARRTAA